MMTQFILSLLCCASDRLDWFIQTTCAEVGYYCSRKHHCSPTCRHKKIKKALIEHNYFPRSCVGYGENTAVEKSQVLFLTLKLVIRDTQVRLKRTAVRHWVCGVSTIHTSLTDKSCLQHALPMETRHQELQRLTSWWALKTNHTA